MNDKQLNEIIDLLTPRATVDAVGELTLEYFVGSDSLVVYGAFPEEENLCPHYIRTIASDSKKEDSRIAQDSGEIPEDGTMADLLCWLIEEWRSRDN